MACAPRSAAAERSISLRGLNPFPVAAAPTAQKLRGGYYTPASVASYLASWAAAAGPRILEPSCGDGALLRFLPKSARVVGVERDAREADQARRGAPWAEVRNADFFDWLDPTCFGAWDGVVGNPPFIRYQHWTEPSRALAFSMMRAAGLRPTKLTNAWVPFIVAATELLRPRGRLAMVVPAELLQVNYAAELRGFLVDAYAELTVVTFRRLLFDGVLQEVVLLLGVRGSGPAEIRVIEVQDADSLPESDTLSHLSHAPALLHETEKWTKYFLSPEEIAALRTVSEQTHALLPLGTLAEVDVGVVTGRNQFFVLRPSHTSERRLDAFVRPLVSKSNHVRGIRFRDTDLAQLQGEDALCQLLALDKTSAPDHSEALATYLAEGEAADVHRGYKCSVRAPWWSVPAVWEPHAFMLRQIYDHPRIVANETAATSTDTVHRVRMVDGTPPGALASAAINSVTFAFSEVMGRSYGGGVLELEPREAERLPLPRPERLRASDIDTVDRLIRRGDLAQALDYNDQRLLLAGSDLDPALVATMRSVWTRLRDRRLGRARAS